MIAEKYPKYSLIFLELWEKNFTIKKNTAKI